MNASNTVTSTTPGTRAEAREKTAQARALLRDVARLVDGELETVRHTTTTAIVAVDDVLDALQSTVEDDLREWADLHGENGAQLAAEARGEL